MRGRLDNALEGEYSPGLNPSTRTASVVSPTAGEGLGGRVELIPAGTEVPITVTLAAAGGDRANGGVFNLQIVTEHIGKDPDGQLFSQIMSRTIKWPAVGAVLLAANSPVSFATQCGCPYSMSVAEFRKRAAAHTASPSASAATLGARVILSGSRMQAVLMEFQRREIFRFEHTPGGDRGHSRSVPFFAVFQSSNCSRRKRASPRPAR